MEEVEARTQKCRRPPISRLAFFGGLQGIESLSGGLGRVGGSRSSGPRSVRLTVQVLCRVVLRISDAPQGSARGGGSEGESEEYLISYLSVSLSSSLWGAARERMNV